MSTPRVGAATVGAARMRGVPRPPARHLVAVMVGVLSMTGCTGGIGTPNSSPIVEPSSAVELARPQSPSSVASAEASRNPAELMDDGAYRADVKAGDFVSVIDNPYLPLTPGLTHVYLGDGERVEVTVTRETKEIMGVETVVVVDRVFAGDQVIEESHDWYAQDRWGNVWYFGEATADIEDGQVVDTSGSWQAGVDGARPGIAMLGTPRQGDVYRQEFARGLAEDMAKILSLAQWSDVPYGSFSDVLVTEDWTPLGPAAVEHKMYAAGIGLIGDLSTPDGHGSQLVEIRDS